MSLRRRMILPSDSPWDAGSSGLKGLSFPGVLDTIWSTSAAGQASWSDLRAAGSVHSSMESGRAFLPSFPSSGTDPWLSEPSPEDVSVSPGAAA